MFVEGEGGPGEEDIVAELEIGLLDEHSLLYGELLQYNTKKGMEPYFFRQSRPCYLLPSLNLFHNCL